MDPNAPLRGFSVAGYGAGLDRSRAYKDPVVAQQSFAEALNPSQFTNSLPASGRMGQAPINSQQGANNAWGSVGGSAQDWVTNSYNWLTGNNNTGNSSNGSVGSGHYHAPNAPATTKVGFNNLSEKQAHALQHYALDNQLTYSYNNGMHTVEIKGKTASEEARYTKGMAEVIANPPNHNDGTPAKANEPEKTEDKKPGLADWALAAAKVVAPKLTAIGEATVDALNKKTEDQKPEATINVTNAAMSEKNGQKESESPNYRLALPGQVGSDEFNLDKQFGNQIDSEYPSSPGPELLTSKQEPEIQAMALATPSETTQNDTAAQQTPNEQAATKEETVTPKPTEPEIKKEENTAAENDS
ncbi:MAG: hypothetical protein O3C63_04445 [Cyanobacteria bacterium]|nr:hypothetical protein [Cyanobacteriota bacterium]MDA1020767.1 hypothetical protein [Cyanobacteriota bacterium]